MLSNARVSSQPGVKRQSEPNRRAGVLYTPRRAQLCKPVRFKEDDTPTRFREASTITGGPRTIPGLDYTATAAPSTAYPAAPVRGITVDRPVGGLFEGLSWGNWILGLASVLMPGVMAYHLYNVPSNDTSRLLVALAGATLIPSMMSQHYLKDAANTDMLGTTLPNKLNSAVFLHSALSLLVLARSFILRADNELFTVVFGGLSALGLISSLYVANKSAPRSPGSLPLIPLVSSTIRGGLSSLMSLILPNSLRSSIYSVITVSLIGTGMALLQTHPDIPTLLVGALKAGSTPLALFTTRFAGAGLIAGGIVSLALKEVSDRGLLSGSLPRNLNWGLAGMSGLVAAICGLGRRSAIISATQPMKTILYGQLAVGLWAAWNAWHPPAPSALPALPGRTSGGEDLRSHNVLFERMAVPIESPLNKWNL